MTPERQNEIWAMLTQEEKAFFQSNYNKVTNDPVYVGYSTALASLFGKHNLTSQAEENCTNPTENSISDSKIQSESAESVETSAKEDPYFAYRLDLAKEIAVAMIPDGWNMEIAKRSVDLANKIVKRLKETEE